MQQIFFRKELNKKHFRVKKTGWFTKLTTYTRLPKYILRTQKKEVSKPDIQNIVDKSYIAKIVLKLPDTKKENIFSLAEQQLSKLHTCKPLKIRIL